GEPIRAAGTFEYPSNHCVRPLCYFFLSRYAAALTSQRLGGVCFDRTPTNDSLSSVVHQSKWARQAFVPGRRSESEASADGLCRRPVIAGSTYRLLCLRGRCWRLISSKTNIALSRGQM
ncbi:hypothetical protein LSAT2_012926, partial [Lamellibrachia satsuma]